MENIEWLKDVIYLIPLMALVWKGASLSGKVKQNESDIKELKSGIKEQFSEILASLKSMNSIMQSLKTDIDVLKALRKNEVDK